MFELLGLIQLNTATLKVMEQQGKKSEEITYGGNIFPLDQNTAHICFMKVGCVQTQRAPVRKCPTLSPLVGWHGTDP